MRDILKAALEQLKTKFNEAKQSKGTSYLSRWEEDSWPEDASLFIEAVTIANGALDMIGDIDSTTLDRTCHRIIEEIQQLRLEAIKSALRCFAAEAKHIEPGGSLHQFGLEECYRRISRAIELFEAFSSEIDPESQLTERSRDGKFLYDTGSDLYYTRAILLGHDSNNILRNTVTLDTLSNALEILSAHRDLNEQANNLSTYVRNRRLTSYHAPRYLSSPIRSSAARRSEGGGAAGASQSPASMTQVRGRLFSNPNSERMDTSMGDGDDNDQRATLLTSSDAAGILFSMNKGRL